MPRTMYHLAHPTDLRRTVGHHYRTACGRWAGIPAFVPLSRDLCPKCAVEQLLADTAVKAEGSRDA